jgi:glc operon protein GlcG
MREVLAATFACVLLTVPASAVTVSMSYKTVTQEAANAMVAVCTEWAKKNNITLTVVVVDAAGNVVASERMDGASVITTQMAPWKAKTSVRWRRPSKWIAEQVKAGRLEGRWLGDVAVQGGLPLMIDNRAIGGIGAGGGTNQQDEDCVRAGIETVMGAKAAEDAVKGVQPAAQPR